VIPSIVNFDNFEITEIGNLGQTSAMLYDVCNGSVLMRLGALVEALRFAIVKGSEMQNFDGEHKIPRFTIPSSFE
jgi:hypothetical protein